MASRGNRRSTRSDHEESDEETDDEDYATVDEESEEEYEDTEAAGVESPEIVALAAPAGGGDGVGGGVEDEGEEEEVALVMETGWSIGRKRECEESSGVTEGQLPADSDPSCLPSCPICLVPWTPDGAHRVCCIPCGHVYGRSCLERWMKRCKKNVAKCPQCSARFKQTEMINLYAPLIAVSDTDLEKEVLSLREKNEILRLERDRLMEEIKKSKKMACLEVESSGVVWENCFTSQNNPNTNCTSYNRCVLQNEIPVDGARVLGIDASSQILIVSGKKPGQDSEHYLNKISLLGRCEIDRILLPPQTGAVRDLCILPGCLALIASLGKKISLLSMLSNNVVLKYDLPAPAWSCSVDVNEPCHIYAGLQNGMLLMFDIRQTAGCLESIEGLSRFPIHSICSLKQNHCSRKVLTASSVGPCLWDVGGSGQRPFLIPELESQGICISLACDSSSSDIVASFRPKVELSGDPIPSQTPLSPSESLYLSAKLGSHVHLKRIDSTSFQKGNEVNCYVSQVRMSKSVVIFAEGKNSMFACGDESTRGVYLWNLPSFQLHSCHRPHQSPILDIKYSSSVKLGLLGAISENKLQVFSCS
ncbi:E3 ubiquitin-protein ligase RFWD3-like [Phalaenopsis equestris]|uniref:E3 ubiquitin-protein ligase RFWD3-like n=1 Tax=Phalaenopsis equestris TaxID=78828 RepID=UPI0009E4FC56|nr:E3 ubiquitin-protein ligase RFWD3-like [Phalaenopsis equestris]XP_020587616.1 E3 ubiquitin-protein ligase RFWD3-like [Phalaenopsis equestris]